MADRETTTNPPTTVAAPPRVWVPSFVFDHVSDARREARRLGIHLRVRRVNDSSWEEGTVLDQSRSGRVKPGATIVVTVARTPPCTEGYDPCLSPASDYDCLGGSGDGPEYTGRVRVTGSDPYDLDRDGDGWGCE
ncbi:MAG: PASTA domain-containing protein [Actinobacteria bacterium]|nr:PASTA domain-containing protein [Actinomycetota bacterium]